MVSTYFSHSLYLQTACVLKLICNSKFNTHGTPVTVCRHKQKNKTKIKPHPGHLFPAEVNGMVVGGRPELSVGCLPRCVISPPNNNNHETPQVMLCFGVCFHAINKDPFHSGKALRSCAFCWQFDAALCVYC